MAFWGRIECAKLAFVVDKDNVEQAGRMFRCAHWYGQGDSVESDENCYDTRKWANSVDRAMYAKLPYRRVAERKFKESGVLLPFGSSVAEFDTPNP